MTSSTAIVIPSADRPREIHRATILGSDGNVADVVIDDPSVSHRHAALVPDETAGLWHVRDLGSTHGTYVDGVRVIGERALAGKHELQLGRARVAFVVEQVSILRDLGETGRLERAGISVVIERVELDILRALAAERALESITGGFVRTSRLVLLVPSLTQATVRQVARRLERRLAGLGEPPVLEICDRRGYRVTTRLEVRT